MQMFPSCFWAFLSYLRGISSGGTDRAVSTSGETEFYPRWETLGEKPRSKRYLNCFPSGVTSLLLLSALFEEIIRVFLIIIPDRMEVSWSLLAQLKTFCSRTPRQIVRAKIN
jgi:hypothetical protein